MFGVKGGYAPYGKTGEGIYGKSLGKHTLILLEPVRYRVLELVKTIPFTNMKSVFNIGDYGCADGSTSMTFIRDLIVTLKEHHGPEVQFQVIYEDQPINDFNSLFSRLHGIIPDPPSYLLELDNVFPMASGREFRKQCVPTESMHFIMSVAAVQWLSKAPVVYTDCFYLHPDTTAEEKEALNEQARVDWETFLLMRSRELKHGGILLVVCPGEYEDDDGKVRSSSENLLQILNDVWKSFRDSGRITRREFMNTNLASCPYSLKQLQAPFYDSSSPVFKSGLCLLSSELNITPYVIYEAWREKLDRESVDDREGFARKYVEVHRCWSNNIFMTGLSDDRGQQKVEIVDDLYRIVEERIRSMSPEKFKNDNIFSYILIRKD